MVTLRCDLCGRFMAYDDAWVGPDASGELELYVCGRCVESW